MAIRDKIRTNAAPQLRAGEQIQSVFTGQTASAWLIVLGALPFILINRYYTIIVTDQRILVCQAGKLTSTAVKSVLRELARQTLIGPAHGLWYKSTALGEPVYIHKRWQKDIEAADALADQSSGRPPMTPPDYSATA
jgi:hypothetical protein